MRRRDYVDRKYSSSHTERNYRDQPYSDYYFFHKLLDGLIEEDTLCFGDKNFELREWKEIMRYLNSHPEIEGLRAVNCDINDEVAKIITSTHHLKKITLTVNQISAKGAQYLSRLTLDFLDLSYNSIDNEAIANFEFSQIKELHLSGCVDLVNAGVAILLRNPHIKSLDLTETDINDHSLVPLSENTTLISLDISRCPSLTAGVMHFVKNNHTLKRLSIHHNPEFGDEAVNILCSGSSCLEYFALTGTKLTNQSLESLLDYPGSCELVIDNDSNFDKGIVERLKIHFPKGSFAGQLWHYWNGEQKPHFYSALLPRR